MWVCGREGMCGERTSIQGPVIRVVQHRQVCKTYLGADDQGEAADKEQHKADEQNLPLNQLIPLLPFQCVGVLCVEGN